MELLRADKWSDRNGRPHSPRCRISQSGRRRYEMQALEVQCPSRSFQGRIRQPSLTTLISRGVRPLSMSWRQILWADWPHVEKTQDGSIGGIEKLVRKKKSFSLPSCRSLSQVGLWKPLEFFSKQFRLLEGTPCHRRFAVGQGSSGCR